MRWSYEDENIQTDTYEDMLEMKYPYVSKHSRMSLYNRAAQFAPFAALTGYDEAVIETARLTDRKLELDEYTKEELNRKLNFMAKLEHTLNGSFNQWLSRIEDGILNGSMSASCRIRAKRPAACYQ